MKPLVLLSNDDGVGSPHLMALADRLAAHVEVLVVAPERQRSAASHAITLHKPLRLTEVAAGRYSLSGTPVDCVYVGMLKVAPRPPALVLSGINDGYNLGTDVFYSGTVAAAVEGALRGAVGVALSIAPRAEPAAVEAALGFVAGLVAAAGERPLRPGTVLNVNFPATPTHRYRWTVLGRRLYEDDVAARTDPRGRPYYWVGGGPTGHDAIDGSDCVAIDAGEISVTPMHLALTDHAAVATPPLAVAGFEPAVAVG
ncbi:MAG: 5'/3'-nucleotidase SurE [Kofleriaceae bacterium]